MAPARLRGGGNHATYHSARGPVGPRANLLGSWTLANVTLLLAEFEKGCRVGVVYDDATGLLRGIRAQNTTVDKAIIAMIQHPSGAIRRKIAGPGEQVTDPIPALAANRIGAAVADPDTGAIGWPDLQIGFICISRTHPEAQ